MLRCSPMTSSGRCRGCPVSDRPASFDGPGHPQGGQDWRGPAPRRGWSKQGAEHYGIPQQKPAGACYYCGLTDCEDCGAPPSMLGHPEAWEQGQDAYTEENEDQEDEGGPVIGPLSGFDLYLINKHTEEN